MGGNLYTEATEKSVPVVSTPTEVTTTTTVTVEAVPTVELVGTPPAVGSDTVVADAVGTPSPSVVTQ